MRYMPTYKFLDNDYKKDKDDKSPFRKVVDTVQVNGGYIEELDCGHELFIKEGWSIAKKRRCKNCGDAKKGEQDELSSVR